MEWEKQIGKEVIYQTETKNLIFGTVGILSKVVDDWCVIVYPQNTSFEYNSKKDTWVPIKGAPNQLYCHSVKLKDIKLK